MTQLLEVPLTSTRLNVSAQRRCGNLTQQVQMLRRPWLTCLRKKARLHKLMDGIMRGIQRLGCHSASLCGSRDCPTTLALLKTTSCTGSLNPFQGNIYNDNDASI